MGMQHSRQDAYDAYERHRTRGEPVWHPLLAAIETEPGVWHMVAQYDRCYAVIRTLRLGDEIGYRAVTWAPDSADRTLIGYYRTLRGAAAAAHRRWLDSHAGQGGVNGT